MKKNKNIIATESFLAKWLEGTITDKELKILVSNEGFNAYKKIRKGITVLDELDKPLSSSLKSIQNKIIKKKKAKLKKQNFKWGISIAASLLMLFGLFTEFNNQDTLIKTSFSEQKTVLLLDGSEVVLNAKSEISYLKNNWEDKREILLKGEAYFKVKKGSTFTVQTEYGTITVLGTQFNVNASNKYFEVTCYEGKVKVTNNNKNYILKPSNRFRKINDDNVEEHDTTIDSPAWVKGESNFKSVPLKYVIIALEKQYDIEIDANAIDDSLIFTGSFTHKNIDVALASVFKTMEIKYEKKKNKLVKLNFEYTGN